ncbi:MAG: MoaD/ThiS family protein [Candidatus Aenigmatarchaeota archaeon]
MPVKVIHEDVERDVDISNGTKVEEVLEEVDVNPETVIAEVDGEVVSLEEEVEGGEELKLLNVVSGG